MKKAKIILFTSVTCPYCPAAKNFIKEYSKTRDDMEIREVSNITPQDMELFKKFEIRSVPTFLIIGPDYEGFIGLKGVQTKEVMDKYIDISLGKRKL